MAKPTTDMTRDLPSLSLRASFAPGSVNVEARTAELVWTTGARVLRGFWERYWEELSLDPKHVRMERLNNGAPLLAAHNGYELGAVLGVVESARLEKGKGTAVVRFAKAEHDPEAERVFQKVRDGILQNISVGYRVHKLEKIEDGDAKTPVYRATDWEPYELSVVPMGADDGAGFRSGDGTARNPCVIITREEKSMDEKTEKAAPATDPVEGLVAAAREKRAKESEAAEAASIRAAQDAAAAERERIAAITSLVRMTKLGDDFAENLIRAGTKIDKVREIVLNELATRDESSSTSQHTRIGAGDDASDKFVRGASAWLFERTGVAPVVEKAVAKEPGRFKGVEVGGGGEFRGMTLRELARESLERRGVKTRGMSPMDLVGLAFTYRAGYQTTSDFSVLLENVLHKSLLGAYAITDDTWSKFCKVDTVADFRPSNRFRTGSLSVLDSVAEHGEFQNKIIPDGQKTSISVGTKGNIIALSRQAIVNDDMSALADMATKLGRAARLSIEVDVYALLTANSGLGPTQGDSQPFFHANRANVNATGSALTVDGLEADAVVMASQKDISSNEYLDLQPAVLLVPRGLLGTGKVLNDAQYEPTANKLQIPNKVRGLVRDVVGTPRLTGTRRYLFADPSVAPAIVVAFLEGQGQAPVLDSENGWRVDGVEWKVRLDYKAQMFDPKGAVTNAGQ